MPSTLISNKKYNAAAEIQAGETSPNEQNKSVVHYKKGF